MRELLQSLLTLELLGLAALPLAMILFRAFPDRGYGLSKILGLLLIAFINWWLGSIAGLANQAALLWVFVLALFGAGAGAYRAGLLDLPPDRRDLLTTWATEEGLFLIAFVAWAAVRWQNGAIYETEQPMDAMLLQVSALTHSFPPPDAWLSGHTVNYYYLGYAVFAMLGNMAGVDTRYGFNLSNIAIFALGCAGAYSITLALVKQRAWALAGVVALMLAGNFDGTKQFLTQWSSGSLSWHSLDLFCSTRVIDGGCSGYHTITEFPIFSVIWNDLHPHLMALPFALLAIGAACAGLLDTEPPGAGPRDRYLRLALVSLIAGALFPLNSWDYPTYLAIVLGGWLLGAYRQGTLARRGILEIAAIVPASLLLYLPYYLTVHLSGQGIGWRGNPSALGDVLTVIGPLLIPATILVVWRGVTAILEPDPQSGAQPNTPAWHYQVPAGWGWWALYVAALALLALSSRTDVILSIIVALAVYTLLARARSDSPATLAAVGLALAGALVLLLSDYVYLKDIFDGGASYRMNTVFKLYYQAWILLAIAAAFGIVAVTRALLPARPVLAWAWFALVALLAAAVLVYPILGIGSHQAPQGTASGLDGFTYIHANDPQEYDAIEWIRAHTASTAVIAEAGGTDAPANSGCGEYWVCTPQQSYDKISALTGRPTILGWPGSHESLWRGAATDLAAARMLNDREADIRTLYTTTSKAAAQAILRKYDVQYVYVGPVERGTYVEGMNRPSSVVDKFAQFLKPVFSEGSVKLYRVPA